MPVAVGGVFECGGETKVGVSELSTVLEVRDEDICNSVAISGIVP